VSLSWVKKKQGGLEKQIVFGWLKCFG